MSDEILISHHPLAALAAVAVGCLWGASCCNTRVEGDQDATNAGGYCHAYGAAGISGLSEGMSIHVDHLVKYYRVHHKEAGLGGSLRSLFRRRYEDVKAVH